MNQNIPDYKSYLQSNKYADLTIKSYIIEIEKYFSLYPTLSRANIISYTNQISHLSAASFNHHLSSLKSFNEYLFSINAVDSIYIIKRDFIKQQHKGNPTNITNNQAEKFLKKVVDQESIYKSRDIAITYLIANTGIRRVECCNIKLSHLDLEAGELIVRGKGNKERTVPLNDITIQLIKKYLIDRSKHKLSSSPYLFLSERSEKLSTQAINDIFAKYGTPKNKISPHQLRHNLASKLLEDGTVDLAQLRDLLGHSNVSTTDIYTHTRGCELKKKIKSVRIG